MNTYDLIAENYSGNADADALLARLGDAVVAVTPTTRTMTVRGTERTITGLRVTVASGFDGVRNTEAHGLACAAGFLAFCE